MTNDTRAILAALKGIEAAIHTQTGAMYSIESQRESPMPMSTRKAFEKASQGFAQKRKTLESEISDLNAESVRVSGSCLVDPITGAVSTS